jgi:GT2 family glycosyltransferase
MLLSVVIVNYNVSFFLEQCLKSVFKALEGINAEVFVVDNHSVDESVRMVKEKFPSVILIENKDNVGFSKANNQAIALARGRYVLLLNPDTVVEEDTFSTCISFMDAHPEAGACGVKLIDGQGNFLPESKRGLPTPAVAFYKIFGLSRLFPKSKKFGKYHLGYLDAEGTHSIDVLSGAFMFIRKDALEKSGYLDEDFFMYGEDIDLSYRITQAGYKIYYHPKTRVIHYRGESTKKSSINYVFIFYQAMVIFARKHFSPNRAQIFAFLIQIAVWARATISIIKRVLMRVALPCLDALTFFGGTALLKMYWAQKSGIYYPYIFLWVVVPLYALIWMASIWMQGGYDKPYRWLNGVKGIFWGTLLILVIYALLPEYYRFSRFLTLVGAAWACLGLVLIRILIHTVFHRKITSGQILGKRILVIGKLEEARKILNIIQYSTEKPTYTGIVFPGGIENLPPGYTSDTSRLSDLVEIFKINEIIFCAQSMGSGEIMDYMILLNKPDITYKIAPPESLFIIGTNSIQKDGDYLVGLNSISRSENKRKKRLLDIVASLFFLGLSPLLLMFFRSTDFMKSALSCLVGKKTWVGYSGKNDIANLPYLPEGVFYSTSPYNAAKLDNEVKQQADILYAKDYKIINDIRIIATSFGILKRKN